MNENTDTESGIGAELVGGEVRITPEEAREVEVARPGGADVLRVSVRSESLRLVLFLDSGEVEALQERLAAESDELDQIDATG